MSRTLPPLALLDWGIGGLGVRAALAQHSPGLAVTYVSDSGFTPYGLLSRSDLKSRLAQIVNALAGRGVERVFLACNAASTALEHNASFALPVSGMIGPGVAAIEALQLKHVGVVAGRRTVRSGAYRKHLARRGIAVSQRVAQPLSAAIERGACDTAETRALVRTIVAPLAHAEAILLACTHYPAALAAFRAALPRMLFVDPAAEAAASLLRACPASGLDSGEDRILTTGDPGAMRRSAFSAFGAALPVVEKLKL